MLASSCAFSREVAAVGQDLAARKHLAEGPEPASPQEPSTPVIMSAIEEPGSGVVSFRSRLVHGNPGCSLTHIGPCPPHISDPWPPHATRCCAWSDNLDKCPARERRQDRRPLSARMGGR